MKTLKLVVISLLVMNLSINSFSQSGLTFNLLGALPVSDYGSDDIEDENSGGVGFGFGAGVQYVRPLMPMGLGIFVGIDAIYAGYKQSVKEDWEEYYESQFGSGLDFTWPKIFNFPISAGLNYTFETGGGGMGIFANAGLTYNFMKMTDTVLEADEGTVTSETDLAKKLGFKIGAGIILNEHISVFVNYLGLGEHELNGHVKSEGLETLDFEGKQKIDIITAGIGIRF